MEPVSDAGSGPVRIDEAAAALSVAMAAGITATPIGRQSGATPFFTHRARQVVTINVARRRDPSRTATLRRRFEADLRQRFARLMKRIRREVAELDGFGLEPAGLKANRGQFDFPRSAEKVAAFMAWLRAAARQEILSIGEGVPIESAAQSAWTRTYIETAYQRGIANAGANLRAAGAQVEQTWVLGAFNRPIHADRVGLIFTRVFRELDGVTEAMDKAISKVLAQGIAEGQSPLAIARVLNDRVRAIGLTRARTIARTEVIAAHADATLNAYTEAGIEGVEVEAEWSTTGDAKVCPLCRPLEGRVFSIEKARNMLPRHPNCRCAWRPKLVGGSGIVLNWRTVDVRRPLHTHHKRRRNPSRAMERAHAHGRAGGSGGCGCT